MADDPAPKRRLNFNRALAAGRRQGGLLGRGAPITDVFTSDRRADAANAMEEAERRFKAGTPLWEREWAATAARGVLRTATDEDDGHLAARARDLLARLHARDEEEIGPIRARLAAGAFDAAALRTELAARPAHERDPFVRRLLDVDRVPDRVTDKPAGMVHYVPSPLAAVLALADLVGPDDVFYDIGSGLGLVTMLVSWLSGARAKGVEYEPAYHEWAAARASELGFDRIEYVCADARTIDYSDATVVYFFDSFRGEILEEMVEVLWQVALQHPITMVSRGMSNPVLEAVPWLQVVQRGPQELLVFRSAV